jgi:hypothetical protein
VDGWQGDRNGGEAEGGRIVTDTARIDPNVEAVRERLADRARVGLLKYGVDTTRTDLTEVEWLRHAQAEALDFSVYLEKIIADRLRTGSDTAAGGSVAGTKQREVG